jgi:2-methylisocitrate lyase-like PEP mutase family enzyme
MTDRGEQARRFLALHQRETPLLLPNAWDAGSAKLLESLGFEALATTSSGHAATLGRLDGGVSRDEALEHAATLVSATQLPVSADLENAFAHEPEGVAETISLAIDAGLAGCSVEDFTGDPNDPIYELSVARDRVAAAVQAAHSGPVALVLTARAENYLHGRPELEDTIERLLAYQEAGADVLYAPGLSTAEEIHRVIDAVDRPVNVLARPGLPPVSALGVIGVSRVSVGGAFAFNALGALIESAQELRDHGTYGFSKRAGTGVRGVRAAFAGSS